MLCEKCKKKNATVFYRENINGKIRSYSLCSDCADKLREKGEIQDVDSLFGSFSSPFEELTNGFFGNFFGFPSLISSGKEKKCPKCGATYADIAKTGRVGCPECYHVFSDELSHMIGPAHGNAAHTESVPSRRRSKKELSDKIKSLKKELQQAVELEEYEHAAKLRDEIRALQKPADGKEN